MSTSEFDGEYEDWLRGDERRIRGGILKDALTKLEPRQPVTVAPETSVARCLDLIRKNHFGCVLVTDGDVPVGIFTERDVVAKVAGLVDPSTTAVREVMTANPETLPADARIVVALNRMMVGGYRHIPVVDGAGKAIGIVSVRDVVRYFVGLFPEAVLNQPSSARLKHPERMDGG